MAVVMTSTQLVNKLNDIAKNRKTVYVYGAFGQPVTQALLKAKAKQYSWFYTTAKMKQLSDFVGKGYFGFDCVNVIKGVLWGWNGSNTTNGGAKYASNGVPDVSADGMIAKCSEVTTDFSKISVGEAVWMPGHIGIYIGNGLAIECTPKWDNKVQITACNCSKAGYNRRDWKKHGKLPYIKYESTSTGSTPLSKPSTTKKLKFKKGDIVNFAGGKHYPSDYTDTGSAVRASMVKVTAISNDGKHPYHCRSVNASGAYVSGVYGWVDESTLSPIETDDKSVQTIQVGSLVKVTGTTFYSGDKIPSWVKSQNWYVKSLSGNRALIDKSENGKYAICSPIKLTDISLANK